VLSAYTSARIRDRSFFANQTAKLFEVGVERRSACLMPVALDTDSQSEIFAGSHTIAMKQSEQKNRRLLTGLREGPRLAIPGRGQDGFASARENFTGFDRNDFRIHSRDVYVLPLQQRQAGVSSGLTTEANSGSRQPTRQEARWVFSFLRSSRIPEHFEQLLMTE
jgi:hypothetical protein